MILAVDLAYLSYINYIFYVILGVAVLAGFIRGFKKTVYAFIMMAIFYLVFFLTINQAVDILWKMQMPWLGGVLGNIDPSLSNFTSFQNNLNDIVNVLLGGNINLDSSSAEVLALATGLVRFVLKLAWTLVYFTVILILWKLITWIIGAIFLKTREKASKNRGFGALFGVANGLLSIFVVMIMMGGLMSVVSSTIGLMQDTQPQSLSFEMADRTFDGRISVIPMADSTDMNAYIDELQTMVDAYNNNIFVKVANSITTPSVINNSVEVPLNIDLFDRVLSFEFDGNTVGLRYELSVFSNAASVLVNSDFYTTRQISDITGAQIHQIFTDLSQSTLIVGLMPVAIEVASDIYDVPLPITKEELYAIPFDQELANIGSIAEVLFDVLNGAGYISGDGSVDQITIDGDTVIGLFDDIANSEVLTLVTKTLLLPMLEDSTGEISMIITVPANLDIPAEYRAIGAIFAEIIDANISFTDLENADINVFLDAASKVNFDVLLDSQLVTEALINILSGNANIQGLDMLTIPADIQWRDYYVGDVLHPGELRNILDAVKVISEAAATIDFENLDINTLLELDDTAIETFFSSYVIRATVTELVKSIDFGDVPLVFPSAIYDEQNYFTEDELVAVTKAIKLIAPASGEQFDIIQALNLTDTEINTLLASQIISATIGKEIYDLGTSSLVIPSDTLTPVATPDGSLTVVKATEIKAILEALAVLQIDSFDTMSFDAGILATLENSGQTAIDQTKVDTLLNSAIIHATISDMILGLDASETGGMLQIPANEPNGDPLKTYDAANGLYLISSGEIYSLLNALYSIDITNFDAINLEDTSLVFAHLSTLLESGIIQATVSQTILDLSGTVIIPTVDIDNQPVLITQGSFTYIDATEIEHLFTALDLLGFGQPGDVNTNFDFSIVADASNQDILLDSAIMHATISDRIFNLAGGTLVVPLKAENGSTDVRLTRGTAPNQTEYIVKSELKTLFTAMNHMGFTDFNNVNSGVSSSDILANDEYIYTSSIIQATVSNQILTSASTSLVVPNEDQSSVAIRIEQSDVTYISAVELQKFVTDLHALSLTDLSTFSFAASDIFTLDLDTFFASDIMQASTSKYILDNAGDESALPGTTILLVPTEKRQLIDVGLDTSEQIEKQELIAIINALSELNMNGFGDSMSATDITDLNETQLHTIFLSASFHITVDNMLRDNVNIKDVIPTLAETALYGVDPLTTEAELVNFILAINTLGTGSFADANVDLAGISSLGESDRTTVLTSMIIRNKLTPDLEAAAALDPLYSFDAGDYEPLSAPPFLTLVACTDAMDYFYPVGP